MKRKALSGISILLVIILTACGSAQPTLSVTDIQNTAFPIVMTQYAQTLVAMPTATPNLPTPTDVPTFAPVPTISLNTPSSALLNPPAPNPNASPTPDCYTPAPPKLLGVTVQYNLVNRSGGPVNISFGMYKPNDNGECYTFEFSVRDKQTVLIKILSGCYWIHGYQNGPKPSTPGNDYICLTDLDQIRGITIGKDSVGFN